MRVFALVQFIFTLVFTITGVHGDDYNQVCYVSSDVDGESFSGFSPAQVEPTLCTHLILPNYAVVDWDGELITWEDRNGFANSDYSGPLASVPTLDVILAVGGAAQNTPDAVGMLSSGDGRRRFVTSAMTFLRNEMLSGLSLDFSQLDFRESTEDSRQQLRVLCQMFREAFESESINSLRKALQLIIGLPQDKDSLDNWFDVGQLAECADFLIVNVDEASLSDGRSGLPGTNASRVSFAGPTNTPVEHQLATESVLMHCESLGVPAAKLVAGLAAFSLNHTMPEPTLFTQAKPEVTQALRPDKVPYSEVCRQLADEDGHTSDNTIPNFPKRNHLVSYADIPSISSKDSWLRSKGYGGWAFSSLDMDDFSGAFCGQGRYPLLSALNTKGRLKRSFSSAFASVPTTTPSLPPTGQYYRRICYYTNWAQYRNQRTYTAEKIDPSLCTHLIFSSATIQENQVKTFEKNDEQMYSIFNAHKDKDPSLLTLLAVGGRFFHLLKMTSMLATAENRNEFATSAVRMLRKHTFDGLELDFEYPGNRGSPAGDKQKFTLLVKETRAVFNEEANRSGSSPLLLTAAVAARREDIDNGYEVAEIAKYLDFISVMSYNMHGSWEKVTSHNAPLFRRPEETGRPSYFNVEEVMAYWHFLGAPKSLLNVGMVTYGRGFMLTDASSTGVGAPTSGASPAGTYTDKEGFISYYEVCEKLKDGFNVSWDDVQVAAYAFKGKEWYSYDNARSVQIKIHWLKQQGYGGIHVWAVDLDDYDGKMCGEGRYPLISLMKKLLTTNKQSSGEQKTKQEVTAATPSRQDVQMCYYSNAAVDRMGMQMDPESIDPTLCTHLVFAFAGIKEAKIVADKPTDIELYKRFNDLRKRQPGLVTLLAIGGAASASRFLDTLLPLQDQIQHFSAFVVSFLREHDFDGLDIHAEYVLNSESPTFTKDLFTLFVKKIRAAFDSEAVQASKQRLLLVAGMTARTEVVNVRYDVLALSRYLDYIGVLTFDLYTAAENVTTHHSPLHGPTTRSMEYVLNNWVSLGAPRRKMVVGMAAYGRGFTLVSSPHKDMGASTSGKSRPGEYTKEAGFLSYYEICEKLSNGAIEKWDNEQGVPYMYADNQWYGYDNPRSLTLKVNWLQAQDFGGWLLWSIDLDDYDGQVCNVGPFPLISALRSQTRSLKLKTAVSSQRNNAVCYDRSILWETLQMICVTLALLHYC